MNYKVTLLWIIACLLAVRWGRLIVTPLREIGLLRYTISILALIFIYNIFNFLRKKFQTIWACIYSLLFISLTITWFYFLEIPEERMHIIQYGFLSWVYTLEGNSKLHSNKKLYFAVLLSLILGVSDEFIQSITPNRVFEWADVYLNIGAAISFGILLWVIGLHYRFKKH